MVRIHLSVWANKLKIFVYFVDRREEEIDDDDDDENGRNSKINVLKINRCCLPLSQTMHKHHKIVCVIRKNEMETGLHNKRTIDRLY